ncbi:MAG: NifB/NifX family molybdenum-iron cluster-binding protein [Terracidiphilus sp.]
MKLAITSQGEGLASSVDPRFGRAKAFVLVEPETGTVKTVDNAVNLNAMQGAGIQAAKQIVEMGAKALITGHVGPKAFATLQAAGVKIYPVDGGTVTEVLEQFKAGTLKAATGADVEGHW